MASKSKRLEMKSIPLDKLPDNVQELTIVVVGSVDSSKTTLLGVLANPQLRTNPAENLQNCLDDGNGKVRDLVSHFPHERATGRTSSVSYTPILLDKEYWPALHTNRAIMATDLCGHDKYLKTTVTGVCSSKCDFAFVCIDKCGKQLNPMTKEHLKLLLALRIPFAVIISKIDLQTHDELKATLKEVSRVIKHTKKAFLIKKESDLELPLDYNTFVPIFLASCKTGYGILNLLNFLGRIPYNPPKFPSVFAIDSIFFVPGYGTVVSGCSGINIGLNDKLIIGPFKAKTQFVEVVVRSIHDNYRNFITTLPAGRRGCLCIRFSAKDLPMRNKITSGMILAKTQLSSPMQISDHYRAEITIFSGHYTTVKTGFNALCNIGMIRAPAVFTLISKKEAEVARSGDKLIVDLKFTMPICPAIGDEFIFREGMSVGHGKILSVANTMCGCTGSTYVQDANHIAITY